MVRSWTSGMGLNWTDYRARWYMPELGRFTGVDPIAAQYPHVTPYNYAENEPIGHIDLWGLQKAISVIQMGKNSQGKWYTNNAFTIERGDMRYICIKYGLRNTGQFVGGTKPGDGGQGISI